MIIQLGMWNRSQPQSKDIVIKNPNFSEIDSSGLPIGWDKTGNGGLYTNDSEGLTSIGLLNSGVSQKIQVQQGQYTLSYKACGTQQNSILTVSVGDENWSDSMVYEPFINFHDYSHDFTIPSGVSEVTLSFSVKYTQGTAYLTGVSIKSK